MENFTIAATDRTPAIDFNADAHELRFSGESYPENAAKFFAPVLGWIEEFVAAGKDRLIVADFELTMFNSSTAKFLMNILDILDDAAARERAVTVNWRYHESNDIVQEFMEDLQDDYSNITIVFMPTSGLSR